MDVQVNCGVGGVIVVVAAAVCAYVGWMQVRGGHEGSALLCAGADLDAGASGGASGRCRCNCWWISCG